MPSRKPTFVVVSGGTIFTGTRFDGLSLPTGGADVLTPTGHVRMQPAFGYMYFVDGFNADYQRYNNATNEVEPWVASPGDLPFVDDAGASIIVLYRGRITLAGVVGDPQNWFMSAAGNPLDFDYGATVSATMAVAGNSPGGATGMCPDIITCLAPYGDDLMVMGGDHTLWIMRGDPADGGRIDNISYRTGISGPDAAVFDPDGTLFFFGAGTLWRMAVNAQPEPLSRNRLDHTFSEIDLINKEVRLTWDNVRRGIHMFVSPKGSASASVHFWWDQKTDSFWRVVLPDDIGPSAVYPFDGDSPADTAVLLGGWDGYVRLIDPTSKTDDGATISSRVKLPPINPGGVYGNTKINRMTATMDPSSDPVTMKVYAAESPQAVVAATIPAWGRTLTPLMPHAISRVAGNSLLVELSNNINNTSWAIEGIQAVIGPAGRTKHGRL